MGVDTPAVGPRIRAVLDRAGARAHGALARPDAPLAAALLLALAAILQVIWSAEDVGVALVANLLATLPLALARRRLAIAAAAITTGAVIAVCGEAALLTVGAAVALLAIAYLVAARFGRGWSALLAAPFLLNVIVPFSGREARLPSVLLLVAVVAALALGEAGGRRERAEAARDAAQRDQALMEERARIARELHDIVAHHVSMIAVQAETTRLTTPGLPDEAERRLAAIGDTARDSLSELRRLLGVLRADAPGAAERAPQPGLAMLDPLLEAARATGADVALTVDGAPVPLPAGVDLTAYRILQEALTNARRHAPAAAVSVALRYAPDALEIEVCDEGPGGDSCAEGHGIAGMRERVEMVGGMLVAGPRPGGGFAVQAHLPLDAPAG